MDDIGSKVMAGPEDFGDLFQPILQFYNSMTFEWSSCKCWWTIKVEGGHEDYILFFFSFP